MTNVVGHVILGSAHLEQLVLWRSKGPNLVCNIIGDEYHLPTVWVLWSSQHETPGHHAHLGGCVEKEGSSTFLLGHTSVKLSNWWYV